MPSFAFISVSLFCHVHPNDVSNFRLLIASCGCRSRSEPGGWLEAVRCWLAAGQFHYRPRMLLTIHEVQSTISNVFSKNHKFWPQLIVSSMHHWKKQSWQLQTILARRRRQCPFSCHLSGRIISLLVSAVASLVTRPQHPMEATQQCLDVFVDGVWGDFFCFSKGVHEKKMKLDHDQDSSFQIQFWGFRNDFWFWNVFSEISGGFLACQATATSCLESWVAVKTARDPHTRTRDPLDS